MTDPPYPIEPVRRAAIERPDRAGGAPARIGPYALIEEIGRGAMGLVYRARDDRLGREVAVKTIRRDLLSVPENVRRFRVEAEAASGLDHPNIVPIYEVGGEDEVPYFAMELVRGRTLAQVVADGPLPPRPAASIVRSVALAVAYAHARGVVHRDLKPANVLLDEEGVPRVGDFGLAKRLEVESDLTSTGAVLGTPSFMAPEQADGRLDLIGPRSDIYSMGATLYYLLTGRPPFQAATNPEVIRQVVERDPVSPRQLNRSVPRELDTICLKCLEKSPARRYADASALAEDLGRYLEGRRISARPPGHATVVWRAVRRRPLVATMAAALALVAIAGVVGITMEWREAEARAHAERWERYRADLRAAASLIEAGDLATARAAIAHAPAEYRGWEWRHLAHAMDRSRRVLTGHAGPVRALAFSRDGARLASASSGPYVLVWGVPEGRRLAALGGHAGAASRLLFAAAPGRLFTLDEQGVLRLWDLDAGPAREGAVISGPERPAPRVAMAGDGRRIAVLSGDGTLTLRDAGDGRALVRLGGGPTAVEDLSAAPRGGRLAACGRGAPPVIWDADGRRRPVDDAGLGPCGPSSFSPDGRLIATGHRYPANAVALFEAATGRRLAVGLGHGNSVLKVAFSPDGRQFASASEDQTVRLWDAATGGLRAVLPGHTAAMSDLAFSPDGRRLVTTALDQVPRLWDASTGEPIAGLGGHEGSVHVVAFSPDGRTIATGSADRTVHLWDLDAMSRDGVLRGHEGFVYDLAWTPDGSRVVSCAWDGTVRTWDPEEEREVGRVAMPSGILSGLAMSPDGRLLAVVRSDDAIELMGPDATGPRKTLSQPTDFWRRRPTVAFDPSGRRLAAGGPSGTVRLWDVATGTAAALDAGDDAWHPAVAFSPDGRLVAAGAEDGTIHLWDATRRRRVAALAGHEAIVTALRFSPDGRWLASASEDASACLWDVRARARLGRLPHAGIVHGLAFSPDGTRLATACGDNTVGLWDLATLARLIELRGHHAYVHAVAFSPDGRRLASASGDRTLRIWHARPPATARRGDG